ncbi:hypothetical protein [Xanthomonas hyacinthi]|uniref:hypothetical protein n=1 Tax=Xanthomonas hyacinthi TaxID=56455 RepID=UPI000658B967|nr:hypothetical protein [Xanthomonas hyacinthi]KLD76504.1 hypothetical protein Y886_21050 [Xanthomonas hyacinthi DSM 19077]
MLGLQVADAGSVRLCGQDLLARRAAPGRAGVVLQSAGLPDTLRAGELLEQARGDYRRPRSVAASASRRTRRRIRTTR